MNRPLLTILTVNWNTADYIELMLYSLTRLTYNPYRVLICDNGSKPADILRLIDAVKIYENVELIFRQQKQSGSMAHGEALDILIDRVDTDYFVIMDSDCTFLMWHWDKALLARMDENIKIIGTPKLLDYGRQVSDFPSVFAVMLNTKTYRDMDLSCKPADLSATQDTGWQWRERYLQQKYPFEIFEAHNTRTYQNGPFAAVICAEFYLQGNNTLIASHFGRGSSGGLTKYTKNWYGNLPLLRKLIARVIGYYEKQRWLNIARSIVDQAANA